MYSTLRQHANENAIFFLILVWFCFCCQDFFSEQKVKELFLLLQPATADFVSLAGSGSKVCDTNVQTIFQDCEDRTMGAFLLHLFARTAFDVQLDSAFPSSHSIALNLPGPVLLNNHF